MLKSSRFQYESGCFFWLQREDFPRPNATEFEVGSRAQLCEPRGLSSRCGNSSQLLPADFVCSLRSHKIRTRFKSSPYSNAKTAPKRVLFLHLVAEGGLSTAERNMPPACCSQKYCAALVFLEADFKSSHYLADNKRTAVWLSFCYLVAEGGLEPPTSGL